MEEREVTRVLRLRVRVAQSCEPRAKEMAVQSAPARRMFVMSPRHDERKRLAGPEIQKRWASKMALRY